MTHAEYFEKELKNNFAVLMSKFQQEYMKDVRRCVLRVENKCGKSKSCKMCKHYRMVARMREELKELTDENNYYTFYTGDGKPSELRAYVDAFEVEES